MTNNNVVANFFGAYQRHEANGMFKCLAPDVEFSDLAFARINGDDVRTMWQWFCKKPVEVPAYETVQDVRNRVLKRTRDGAISVLSGAAFIRSPSGLAIDEAGCLYVAERGNDRVRKICPDGTAMTVAGVGIAAFSGDGGPSTSAHLDSPSGITVDRMGNLYIADTGNRRVRRVIPDGVISTVAGNGGIGLGTTTIGDGGPAPAALLFDPIGVTVRWCTRQ